MAFDSLPYLQDSARRAMRGQTPPFLPDGYAYSDQEQDAATPVRVASAAPPPLPVIDRQKPPALKSPEEDPTIKTARELSAQGGPMHPQHGRLRTIGEGLLRGYLGPMADQITDPEYARQRAEYQHGLAAAERAGGWREKGSEIAVREAQAGHTRALTENMPGTQVLSAVERGGELVPDEPPPLVSPDGNPPEKREGSTVAIGGKNIFFPSAAQKKKEALTAARESAEAAMRPLPDAVTESLGLPKGFKVAPGEVDSYVRIHEAKVKNPNLVFKDYTDENTGNVTLVGIDQRDGAIKFKTELAGVAKKRPQIGGMGVSLTPEAVDYWARFAGVTGQLPNLGMGGAGAGARTQILNRAPEVAGGDVASNRATNRADAGSLASMQKMRDAVVAFEKTATANLDLFAKQAKGIIDSGSPWVNTPLRTINRNALGAQDLAAYDAARQVALTEIAKVVNNPSLSSQLSDTARKEVLSLVPENATLGQIYRIVGVLKQDMENRRRFLDQGIGEIKTRLGQQGGGQQGGQASRQRRIKILSME